MPELAKAYEPQQVEDRLYAQWQASGVFVADPKSPKPLYPSSVLVPSHETLKKRFLTPLSLRGALFPS
jgi:hypothetical protein